MVGRHALFEALVGHPAYPWQQRALDLLADGNATSLRKLALPTGTGKTSLIACFLLARAFSQMRMPHRIVWIVNRRTIVDQATSVAEAMVRRLFENKDLAAVRKRLSALSDDRWPDRPVAVSTLRGRFADNGDWALDPSRPAIIVGTIDMLGSRLLFRGYGCGRWKRPQHGGLLGVDSFLVLDEAHLEPAFDALLESIERFDASALNRSQLPPTWFCRVSATLRDHDETAFRLEEEDRKSPALLAKLERPKPLHIVEASSVRNTLVSEALALGKRNKGSRIVVFVENPEVAAAIAQKISARSGGRECLLTGEMRGQERDQLENHAVYGHFRSSVRPSLRESVFLIATSAGEIGADLYADHGVCDLTTAESMLQRFGRIGRSAEAAPAHIVVVTGKSKSKPDPADPHQATLAYLRSLPNASLDSIERHRPPAASFRPAPAIAGLDRIVLEALAATSVRLPVRAVDLDPYLHGIVLKSPMDVYVAWREDVRWLATPDATREMIDKIEAVLDFYPVEPAEMLRTTVNRLLQALSPAKSRDLRCIVQFADGSIEIQAVADLWGNAWTLRGALILLPTEAGGFDAAHGCLRYDSNETSEEIVPVSDVADQSAGEGWRRCRCLVGECEEERAVAPLGGAADSTDPAIAAALLNARRPARSSRSYADRRLIVRLPEGDDGQARSLWYYRMRAAADASFSLGALRPVYLDEHQERVRELAQAIARGVGLDDWHVHAETVAGAKHDEGKRIPRWQRSIGNPNGKPLAKPFVDCETVGLEGFRHELASSVAIEEDLAAHLVAAHHGWSRPHYSEEALSFFPSESERTHVRFARLQAAYGPWGLAYLESVLRSADTIASREVEG